jgi:hypothetical protein
MSMRSDWTAAKARAKSHNNNTAVKFPKDLKLGDLLDKMEANAKLYSKAQEGELGKAWAKAAETYFASALAAEKAALGYQQTLQTTAMKTTVNDVARRDLDSHLTMHIMSKTTEAIKDRDRLAAKIARLKNS